MGVTFSLLSVHTVSNGKIVMNSHSNSQKASTFDSNFCDFVLNASKPFAMPLAVYPGTRLTRWRVRDVVTNPQAQRDVVAALQDRYETPVVFTAMDLSVEAEAFGCPVEFADDEVPTTTGQVVSEPNQIQTLEIPRVGQKRTRVYLETAELLRKLPGTQFVFGGCIGPFTLAARLIGLSEACQLTVTEPELMHELIGKTAAFLSEYIRAFKEAGANGVIMAEPAAGLLSPVGFSTFSSGYVRKIIERYDAAKFAVIFHCCSARVVHLSSALETGSRVLHFGVPMDMIDALSKVPAHVVVSGNLDPVSVFVQGTAATVEFKVAELLEATRHRRNFVISSGCDIPVAAPLANLDAFYRAVAVRSAGK